jgi:alkylated DNA repair dioxygenase AlkB
MNSYQQVSLFGGGEPTFDARVGGIKRSNLSAGAWVDQLDGWLSGHEQLFDWLARDADWHQGRRMMYDRMVDVPRLVALCPSNDGPGGRSVRHSGAVLPRMSVALSMHYGVALPSISLNWYKDGADSVAMHADKVRSTPPNTTIAIVSIGEPRRFNMRANNGAHSLGLRLGWGDLIVMGGSCQDTWQHGVPKVASAAPRMSIVFRERNDD